MFGRRRRCTAAFAARRFQMIRFSPSMKLACMAVIVLLAACIPKPAPETLPPAPQTSAPTPTPSGPVSRIIPGSAEDFRVNVGDTVHFGYNQYNIEDTDKGTLGK